MDSCVIDGCNNKRHVKLGYCSTHYAKYKKYGDPLAGRTNLYFPGQSPKTCTAQGCSAAHAHGGLCQAHYLRKKRLGSVDAVYDSEKPKICAVDGCGKKHYCKSFCTKHYQAWFFHGDPLHHEKNSCMGWIIRHKDYSGDDCLPWPHARLTNGYGVIALSNGQKIIASRAMCEEAHGRPPSAGMHAAHSCGNGHEACMNPNHLRWATSSENCHDKIDHGTLLQGESAPWSILTEDQVRYILDKENSGGAVQLAEKLGVSKWTIYSIRQRRTWSHVEA